MLETLEINCINECVQIVKLLNVSNYMHLHFKYMCNFKLGLDWGMSTELVYEDVHSKTSKTTQWGPFMRANP